MCFLNEYTGFGLFFFIKRGKGELVILWLKSTAQVRTWRELDLFFLKTPQSRSLSLSLCCCWSHHGEIEKLSNRRSSRRWDQSVWSRPLTRSEQWQPGRQPGLMPPWGHSVPARSAPSDRNNPQAECPQSAPSGACIAASGSDSRHVSCTHVPTVGVGWTTPCVRLHWLHAPIADLPRAPEGGYHGWISAPGALDPRWAHGATTAGLQL